jgi:hypothetical protein
MFSSLGKPEGISLTVRRYGRYAIELRQSPIRTQFAMVLINVDTRTCIHGSRGSSESRIPTTEAMGNIRVRTARTPSVRGHVLQWVFDARTAGVGSRACVP